MNFNRVELAGNLTFDPELRHVASGVAVTELRMAVNREWTNESGEKVKEVLYVDATFWKKQAETACQYLRKGSNVFIEGYLKMDEWNDKNTGEKRSKIRVQGERFHFLDKKSDGDGGRQHGGHGDRQPQQTRGGQPQGRGPTPSRGPAPQQPRGGYAGAQGQGRGPQVDGFDRVDDDESVPF